MSCFICNEKTKSRITALIYAATYHAGDIDKLFHKSKKYDFKLAIETYDFIYGDKKLLKSDAEAEQVIYNILTDINAAAVDTRYNRVSERIYGKPLTVKLEDLYTLETYKRLCCFIYQCDENEAKTEQFKPIFEMLKEFEKRLATHLLFNLPEFDKIDGWE